MLAAGALEDTYIVLSSFVKNDYFALAPISPLLLNRRHRLLT
jgi:hypothetical protein